MVLKLERWQQALRQDAKGVVQLSNKAVNMLRQLAPAGHIQAGVFVQMARKLEQ